MQVIKETCQYLLDINTRKALKLVEDSIQLSRN